MSPSRAPGGTTEARGAWPPSSPGHHPLGATVPCPLSHRHSLCRQSPSVQFLESSSTPLQSLPPLRGAGAAHSRLRQWVHSVLQADHLLHSVHAPSTAGHQTQTPGWGRFGTAPPGWGTSVSSSGKVPAPEPLSLGSRSTVGPWKPGVGPRVSEVPLTWAEGGAGYFLEGLPIAEGAAVERCGVGARPCALLPAPAAAVVARRPLGPG